MSDSLPGRSGWEGGLIGNRPVNERMPLQGCAVRKVDARRLRREICCCAPVGSWRRVGRKMVVGELEGVFEQVGLLLTAQSGVLTRDRRCWERV